MHLTRCTWVLLLLTAAGGLAQAQTYPNRPIRFVIPCAAPGADDNIGHMVGTKLGGVLGTQTIIDNRGGAGGSIGVEIAAKAAPDGYTLLLGHSR